ncbi:hypothetical protein, partial [uncultured Oscillibacter sp.]|uniref:hypothetical protein n=1 Tax=uncultured Oscillibacter sp. TaxID=876091 RepID=UPI0025F48FC8
EIAGFSVSGVADLHQIYTNSALNRQRQPLLTRVGSGCFFVYPMMYFKLLNHITFPRFPSTNCTISSKNKKVMF